MSENTTASLKQEILEWANKPGTMEKFTTHDVYEHIHSAETPSHTSDALRSMWKYDKTLDREEFMDGNKKRFVYSLRNKVDLKPGVFSESVPGLKPEIVKRPIDFSAIPGSSVMFDSFAYATGTVAGKEFSTANNNKQIEIPNNFCIEFKTLNGFTITIKSGDLIK